jgi:alkylation response protein AidB-like acyl-CoA dehydrogenase
MDLALTESQEMLRTTARSFMEREAPVDVVVGLQKAESSLDPNLWAKAARLGWLGIVLPTEYGGSGDSLSDAAVLYEELGRGPLPGPVLQLGCARRADRARGGHRRSSAGAFSRVSRRVSVC